MSDSNYFLTLLTAAQAYTALGYSVIPLHGDGDRAKIAAIQWGRYQHTRPTEHELDQWFLEEGFGALGIVTGRISRLVVLDFDSPELFHSFSRQYPDLAEHHVVQTRRGYHIYFQLPPKLTVKSRKGQGIDLLSDGRYAVARPSTIDGHTYKLIRGGQPKLLTTSDIQRVTGFLANQATPVAKPAPASKFNPFSRDYESVQPASSKLFATVITSHDLYRMYHHYAQTLGRNEALFRASLKARDGGWSREDAVKWLAEVHVQQPPARRHAAENPGQRRLEALRTIHSAFSRPARPITNTHTSRQLPNSVREALFKLKRTDVVRTLEGLLLKGIQPGQSITAEEAITLLRGIVGQDSIYHAFNAQTPAGQPIFERQPPSLHPPAPNGAAADKKQRLSNKCFIGGEKNPRIIESGRKKRVFVVPSNLELCHKLGVKPSGSDTLTLDDLATAKQTRMAAHRELIKRRPGIYPRRWLAKRVGVCTKTLDTYNRDIPINVKHLYQETHISWSNLSHIPESVHIDGAFLEDEGGKRYPPKRQIAAILLSKGHSITYKRQDANYYWYGDTPPNVSVLLGFHPRQPEMDVRIAAIQAFTRTERAKKPPVLKRPVTQTEKGKPDSRFPTLPAFPATATPSKRVRKRHYHKPLPNPASEALAEKVYSSINQLAPDTASRISRATARRLVDQYGSDRVEQGLSVLARRGNIIKPVGFLVTWLRSNYPSEP